jgi:D-alanyl-D-alanine carboxypeptidase (penicillin-binding protein 5/6)
MWRGVFFGSLLLITTHPFDVSAAPKSKKTATAPQTVVASGDEEDDNVKSTVPAGCKAELLIDHGTEVPVFELNAHEPLRPASMVKLMTAYVVEKKISNGELKDDDIVTASAKASKTGGSQVYLKQGEQFTVKELLEALMIQSANDAAVALAEHIAGTSEAFVELMNESAKDLGMTESEFHSPHGLPPDADEKPDLVSAHDFGILAKDLIDKYPHILEMTSKIESPFRGGSFIMRNHNKLVIHYQGCDGLKTGFYGLAGFNVVATAKKNSERMTVVTMGCESRKFRDAEAAKLLSKGFAQFKSVRLVKKGETLSTRIPVEGGQKIDLQAVAQQEIRGTLRAGEEPKVVQQAKYCTGLKAPVTLGTPCGTVDFLVGNKVIASGEVIVGEDVQAASGVQKLINFFKK